MSQIYAEAQNILNITIAGCNITAISSSDPLACVRMSGSMLDPFSIQDLTDRNGISNTYPQFVVNYIGDLLFLGGALFLYMCSIPISIFLKKALDKHHGFTELFKQHCFSVFLALLCGSQNYFVRCFALQFSNLKLITTADRASFAISIMMLGIHLSILLATFGLVFKESKGKFREFFPYWKDFQLLFAGYKNKNRFTRYFLSIYLLIQITSGIIYSIPTITSLNNAIIQVAISGASVLIIIIFRPLRSNINFGKLLAVEVINCVTNIIMLNYVLQKIRQKDSELITEALVITKVLVIFILCVVKMLHERREYKKKHPNGPSIPWWKSLLELTGLFGNGFEEVKDDDFYVKGKTKSIEFSLSIYKF